MKLTIPLYYEGHVYREGSRIRLTISAPGGDQPIWAFAEADPDSTPWVAVAHSRRMPSQVLLPVVPGVDAPTELPPCPGLRGQPCRDYVPFAAADGGRGRRCRGCRDGGVSTGELGDKLRGAIEPALEPGETLRGACIATQSGLFRGQRRRDRGH